MNHQPFENWLLDEEPLTSQQRRDLEMHLRGCTSCSGIADSNLALRSGRMANPAPGFADRFRPRLAAWQREQRRRQAIGTVLLVLVGVGLLYLATGPAMLEAMSSPAAWLSEVTAYAIGVLALVSVVGQVGGVLLRVIPGILPSGIWETAFLAVGALGALWVFTMRRLTRAPQGVGK